MKQFYLTLTLKNVLSEENPVNLCPLYTSDLVTGPRSPVVDIAPSKEWSKWNLKKASIQEIYQLKIH